jgi:iron complex outermembrane recepter protein
LLFLCALVPPAATGQSADPHSEPGSDTGKVAEIIVTAQRRSESLQDTPVAVTAITGDALAAQHIDNVSNISAVTPSVNFQSTTMPRRQPTWRFVVLAPSAATAPSKARWVFSPMGCT